MCARVGLRRHAISLLQLNMSERVRAGKVRDFFATCSLRQPFLGEGHTNVSSQPVDAAKQRRFCGLAPPRRSCRRKYVFSCARRWCLFQASLVCLSRFRGLVWSDWTEVRVASTGSVRLFPEVGLRPSGRTLIFAGAARRTIGERDPFFGTKWTGKLRPVQKGIASRARRVGVPEFARTKFDRGSVRRWPDCCRH